MRKRIRLIPLLILLILLWLGLASACKPEAGDEHAGHLATPTPAAGHEGHAAAPRAAVSPSSKTIAGRSAIMISPEKQQLIGLQTTTIGRRVLRSNIRTVGRVEYNEQALAHVHTKVEGWIEKLYADFTGQWVGQGRPLLEIYSPELLAAQKEYLLALQTRKQLKQMAENAEFGIGTADNDALVNAAQQKLLLWDLSPAQIDALARTGQVRKSVTLYAPASGYIIEKKAVAGMQVMPGMELYTLANLATVWVHAQVYEYELPRVRIGQRATMALSYLPGSSFSGQVSYIYPTLDPQTRTATVRIVFANPAGKLKPEMHSEVTIETDSGGAELAIPVDAVIDSGTRKLVFVARPGGFFEPREIVTGARIGDYYQLRGGLKEKEKVVSAANFLVDSESQLKAAAGTMGGHGH